MKERKIFSLGTVTNSYPVHAYINTNTTTTSKIERSYMSIMKKFKRARMVQNNVKNVQATSFTGNDLGCDMCLLFVIVRLFWLTLDAIDFLYLFIQILLYRNLNKLTRKHE